MYLNIYAYGVRSLSCDFHHLKNDPFLLAPSSTTGILFLIIRTLKNNDLAAAFSITLLTEFE